LIDRHSPNAGGRNIFLSLPIISETFMVRGTVATLVLSFALTNSWAMAQSPAAPAATAPSSKPAPKKPPAKVRAATKPKETDSGPCRIGVIPVVGDSFGVQKMGITVFGNEYTEVPIDAWRLDDLVVARVRAAAGSGVKRIAYATGVFEPYEHPPFKLFRDRNEELANVVREITSHANCEHYVVVTKLKVSIGESNQTVTGMGIIEFGSLLSKGAHLFADINVTFFDGPDYTIRKNANAMSLQASLARTFSMKPAIGPSHEVDRALFPAVPAEAAASSALRDGTRALLTETLDEQLSPFLGAQQN
jgi:hypothetical protein